MSKNILIWLLSISLTWNGLSYSAASEIPSSAFRSPIAADPAQASRALTEFLELARQLRQLIDRSQFDSDVLLEQLDYDLGAILEFTTGAIAFEPYAGLLRGSAGTLMSRAGNSLDQAVLLAKLLNDAGFEARIAHGTLAQEDVRRLIATVRKPERSAGPFQDPEVATAHLRRMASLANWPAEEVEARLRQVTDVRTAEVEGSSLHTRANAEAALLVSALSNAGIELGSPNAMQRIRQEAEEYFWVQYRDSGSEWSNAHPAFGPADAPAVSAESYLTGEVPPELQHRIRIESRMVRIRGDKTETVTVLSPWERPAANLAERAIDYSHSPLAIPDETEAPWEFLASGDTYIPVLDGTVASDNAFNLSGNSIPMAVVQATGADLVKTVSEKTQAAESALAGLGRQGGSDVIRQGISEIQLIVTVISPGNVARTFQRTLYNPCNNHQPLIGGESCFPGPPEASDRLVLTTLNSLAISVGHQPESYVLDRTLERMIASEAIWKLSLDPQARNNISDWTQIEQVDSSWLGFLPLFQTLDSSLNPKHLYRPSPTVVLFQQKFEVGGGARVALDILTNTKRAFINQRGVVNLAPEALVYEGVWETAAENYFFIGNSDVAAHRAFPLSRVDPSLSNLAVIRDVRVAPSWGQHVMKGSLDAGYAVVTGRNAPDSEAEHVAWYRVDASTGETLGMTPSGRGGVVEYLLKLLAGVTIIAPVYWMGCAVAGYDSTQCVMFARTAAVFGLGAFTFAVALLSTILLWPSEAH